MKNENIKLEVGKSYLNRMGEVVKIVGKRPYPTTFTYVSEKDYSYQSNGKLFGGKEDEGDLIEEVPMQKKGGHDMKVTLKQIEEALANKMQINNAEDQAIYDCIRSHDVGEAIDMAGIKKSQEYFTKAEWREVYKKIKKIIQFFNKENENEN